MPKTSFRLSYPNSVCLTSISCSSSTCVRPNPVVAVIPLLKFKGVPVEASISSTVKRNSHVRNAAPSNRCGEAAKTHHTLQVAPGGIVLRGSSIVGTSASSDDSAITNATLASVLASF